MMETNSFYKSLYTIWMFMASMDIMLVLEAEGASPAEIDQHLQMGAQMLAKGQLHEALSHFHAAIDGDPSNYLTYYRRATVYLALGRSRPGLQDLDEVLALKPDFSAARMQRASVLLKLGRLDEAYIDIEKVLQKDASNEEANKLFNLITPLQQKIRWCQDGIDSKHYDEALALLQEVVESCPWSSAIRQMRVGIYVALGDIMNAITDLRAINKLTQDNTGGYLRIANMYYQVGDVEQSLSEIRDCLKLDPDHKDCFTFYKQTKKINKLATNAQDYFNEKAYSDCANSAKKILKEEPDITEVRYLAFDRLCQCGQGLDDTNEAISFCNDALSIKEDPRVLCDRAEIYLINEMYDEALKDFQSALNIDEHLQRAKEGVEKSQKLKKQASKRDYYKILGVKRNASKREITKAYRSMAQKWHPDRYDGELKKKAESMFIDIAAAKEVLTDEEKRQKFDNGEDPLDPEQQQQGRGFNPFQQFHFRGGGGFPGGDGGPFHFKFQHH